MVGRPTRADSRFRERGIQLGELLREQREEVLKISRRELAARSQVSAATIQAIETGRVVEPGIFTVAALAVALQIDLSPAVQSLTAPLQRRPLHSDGGDRQRSHGAPAPQIAS
ncbi:helix-turn-helix domain-containing protein [Luteococcus japonicus]|uniref:helix-turn-helix domain-containing protein n=1 Tax=Luteococcus japonicus TaxID=33984 RepID=UPI000B9ABA14